MDSFQWTLLSVAVVLVCWMLGAYNRLQRLRGQISLAAQQIDEPVRRRDELIAGLMTLLRPVAQPSIQVEDLQGLDEASSALMAAAEALKARPLAAEPPARLAVAEVGLQAALSAVLRQVEQDPALRLSPGMLERLAGISEAERRLRFGRQLYNDAVKGYNAALAQWPTRLLRRLFDWDAAATV